MTDRFAGWARCHPHCDWFMYAESYAYELCWEKLVQEVANNKKPLGSLMSMVVLPWGEQPAIVKRTA